MPSILDLALQAKNARGLGYAEIAAEAGIPGDDPASNVAITFRRRHRMHVALADWALRNTVFAGDAVTQALTNLEAAGLNAAQIAGVRTLLDSYGFPAQTSAPGVTKVPPTRAVPAGEPERYVWQRLTEAEVQALFDHAIETVSGMEADRPLQHALTEFATLLSNALALRTRRAHEDVVLEARAAGVTDG